MALFSDPAVGIDDPMLRRAFGLAERGRGTASPNPLVGCVLVSDGAVVGEGFHAQAGGPHAEVVALEAAGDRARGAHAYVTLEPCTHFGKTPPCVDRMLSAGIAEVTIGMRDPNPEVSGCGAEALAAAGVTVNWAADPGPFETQNEAWLLRLRLGRPFVRVKVALTLDGRPALAARRRSKITGAGGRHVTMRLRSEATAIVVGASTVSVDDPELTVRDENDALAERSPRRIVLSRTSAPNPRACVFSADRGECVVVASDAASPAALEPLVRVGARVLTYAYRDGLSGALRAIAADGVNDVLVEAGPSLFTALWRDRFIDELVVVTAGGMSGNAGPPLFLGCADAEGQDLAPVLHPVETGIAQGDAVTVWRQLDQEPGLGKGSVG
ncbi:MAG: bifunctional diaminohydroxyphosphoribosylaminopyrimidine deaminase/5-amino-6-(5-phosphoribosylamino)uracil reductase RibD [Coriobacteriia bacterium]|nr:bifunctional diaminohydroxyphosphoribosylaminopyrimidine deaminase/5-amino-6-(5-phosphoribosylamino)uracil reductase RibD [Coriobacteriia bacterium]